VKSIHRNRFLGFINVYKYWLSRNGDGTRKRRDATPVTGRTWKTAGSTKEVDTVTAATSGTTATAEMQAAAGRHQQQDVSSSNVMQ
jgi:hypothetical protein